MNENDYFKSFIDKKQNKLNEQNNFKFKNSEIERKDNYELSSQINYVKEEENGGIFGFIDGLYRNSSFKKANKARYNYKPAYHQLELNDFYLRSCDEIQIKMKNINKIIKFLFAHPNLSKYHEKRLHDYNISKSYQSSLYTIFTFIATYFYLNHAIKHYSFPKALLGFFLPYISTYYYVHCVYFPKKLKILLEDEYQEIYFKNYYDKIHKNRF